MDINPVVEYLLSRQSELQYWTNEEDYAFAVRNEKIFFDFDPELTLEDRRAAAETISPLLPEKIRPRGLDSSKEWMTRNIDRQTSEEYGFTLIHREFGGRHELHICPSNSDDNKKVVIRIAQSDFINLKELFQSNFDDLSRQTQFKI